MLESPVNSRYVTLASVAFVIIRFGAMDVRDLRLPSHGKLHSLLHFYSFDGVCMHDA